MAKFSALNAALLVAYCGFSVRQSTVCGSSGATHASARWQLNARAAGCAVHERNASQADVVSQKASRSP
eukprot:6225955-Amphidinium_carterae.1